MLIKIFPLQSVIYIILFNACQSSENNIRILYPEGGYKYSAKIEPRDTNFYRYPLKDIMQPKDSFRAAYDDPEFYKHFNEPNISLRPTGKSIFRFIHAGYGSDYPANMIILTENEIIIKEGLKGDAIPYWIDTKKLSEKEYSDLNYFDLYFPLSKRGKSYSVGKNHFLDSLITANPKLLQPEYYKLLMDKAKSLIDKPFYYKTYRISISTNQFKTLVDSINTSGYWKLPYDFICNDIPSDASSYALEANTPEKYNYVTAVDCIYNDSKFAKACQQLIDMAGMRKKVCLTATLK